jgi:1-deoxy-D-xylulose-5-phosphate synthase
VQKLLTKVPVLGDPVERLLVQAKDAIKAGMLGGMLFEELGFSYLGPVDGHNLRQLQKYLAMVRKFDGPVLLHVVTEKGHGFRSRRSRTRRPSTPRPLSRDPTARCR